jgi:hypothetical protein
MIKTDRQLIQGIVDRCRDSRVASHGPEFHDTILFEHTFEIKFWASQS